MIKDIINSLQEELIAFGEGAFVDNKSRMVVHDDKMIYVLSKPSGLFDCATYSPELYYIMCNPSICSYFCDSDKERLHVEILRKQENKKYWKGLLGRFILLWEEKECSTEAFLNCIPKGENTVDHLNGDKHNHCSWNLTGISRKDNSRKGTLATRIQKPYFCYTAVDENGSYRIHFGWRNRFGWGQSFYLICEDVDKLIHFYRTILKIDSAAPFLRNGETLLQICKENKELPTSVGRIRKEGKEAELLLKMSADDFDVWTYDSTIGKRKT